MEHHQPIEVDDSFDDRSHRQRRKPPSDLFVASQPAGLLTILRRQTESIEMIAAAAAAAPAAAAAVGQRVEVIGVGTAAADVVVQQAETEAPRQGYQRNLDEGDEEVEVSTADQSSGNSPCRN